jgi:O-antigen/teichoic acid export membrane protein
MSSVAARIGRLRPPAGVARNTVFSGVNSLIALALGLVSLPLLLHHIGAPRTGLLTFATTLTGYFTAVDISVSSSVTRYVAEHRAREDEPALAATVRSSLLVLLGFGVAMGLILAVLAVTAATALFGLRSVRGVAEPTILIAAVTTAVYWPSRIGLSTLAGLERYDQVALVQIARWVFLLVGLVVLLHLGASIELLAVLFGVASVSDGVLGMLLSFRPLGVSRRWLQGPLLRNEHLRGVIAFGSAAFVIGIADTLLYAFDRTIVGAIVGPAAIVGYNAAQYPMMGVRVIAGLAGLALVSPVARLWTIGRTDLVKVLVLTSTLVSVVMTEPVAVIVMVLARPFLDVWLGPGYGHDAVLIDVFVAYWLLNCAATAASSALYGIGRLEMYARLTIIAAVISLPLSIGLTYAWGTIGVIWGTTIPATVATPVFLWYALRLLEIPLGEFLRAAILPAAVTVIPWTAVVVAADLAVHPRGWGGIIAFGVSAVAIYWLALMPKLRREIRAARRIAEEELPR